MCGPFASVVAHLFCNFFPVSHSLYVESLSGKHAVIDFYRSVQRKRVLDKKPHEHYGKDGPN